MPIVPEAPQTAWIASTPALPHAISLREFFAAAAMQGAIAHHGLFPRETMAADCFKIADQMLAARK